MKAAQQVRTIAVGAGGTATAFAAVMAVRRHWDASVRVIIMDTNPSHLVATSLLADAYQQVPAATDSTFPEALISTLALHHADTYLPLIDLEVALAARLLDEGLLPGHVRLLAPQTATAALCLDKLAAHDWMMTNAIPTPPTRLPLPEEPDGEWFLKPRHGFGSRGAHRVVFDNSDSLTSQERSECVIQALCQDPEITLDVFRSTRFEICRVICRERIETKAGVCTKARVFEDTDLAELATNVAKGLNINGGFCMQVMRLEDQWVVTDVNPRLGAGTAMSVPLGIDFFAAAFSAAWDQDPAPFLPPLDGECYVVRQHSEFVTRRARA